MLSQPITDFQVAGGLLPDALGELNRPVAFFALVTAASADNADEQGTALDPDTWDFNDAVDVFVSAVEAGRIDSTAVLWAAHLGFARAPSRTAQRILAARSVAERAIPLPDERDFSLLSG